MRPAATQKGTAAAAAAATAGAAVEVLGAAEASDAGAGDCAFDVSTSFLSASSVFCMLLRAFASFWASVKEGEEEEGVAEEEEEEEAAAVTLSALLLVFLSACCFASIEVTD